MEFRTGGFVHAKPRIGIVCEGNVGSALAQGLTKAAYQVDTTGNNPERVRQVATSADLIILAVPHEERKSALKEIGDASRGKVLVDATNLVTRDLEYNGNLRHSGAQEVQSWAKEAKVVKAFNTVFAQHMSSGQIDGERMSLLVAGDGPAAKGQGMTLGRDIGFESVDVGDITNARWLEALGILNITMAYGTPKLGPRFGIKVLGAKDSRRGFGTSYTPSTPGN